MRSVRQKAKSSPTLDALARDLAAREAGLTGSHVKIPWRVRPGKLVPIPHLKPADSEQMFRYALLRVCNIDARAAKGGILWRDADDEMVLRAGQATFATGEQLIVVSIPVYTDQSGEAEIVIPFVTNPADSEIGLIAASETKPRGPAAIVDLFGDALVAVAWAALIEVAAAWADAVGESSGQGRLAPAGLAATRHGLRVSAQGKLEPEER